MRRTILLVEDETNIRHLMRRWLEHLGYEVYDAPDGKRGWELVQEHMPELVMTDIAMPEMDGVELCRRVYRGNYELLKGKVEAIAPEIFRWMIVEGYGKVLSRPGLGSVDRELSITSFLMMEDRAQQLYSHMKGALNVGAPGELLAAVVNDIGEAAGAGYETALEILEKLGVK